MNFEGLIDFTKYTLALAAASFVYTLETFVPASEPLERYVILAVLGVFLASSVAGMVIFAVCTKALHGKEKDRTRAKELMGTLGTAHAVLLLTGMIGLGLMLVPRVLRAPEPASPTIVYCAPAPAEPAPTLR